MILDLFRIEKHIGEDRIVDRLGDFLKDRTGKRFPARNGRRGEGYQDWRKWTWSLPYEPHPEYSRFKGLLYGSIDPKMKEFSPPMYRPAFGWTRWTGAGYWSTAFLPWTTPTIS